MSDLLSILDGRKTFIVVACVMAWIMYRVEYRGLPIDDAMGWILMSLLPLAVNSTTKREASITRSVIDGDGKLK